MICFETDSASAICCNVRLADCVGTLISVPQHASAVVSVVEITVGCIDPRTISLVRMILISLAFRHASCYRMHQADVANEWATSEGLCMGASLRSVNRPRDPSEPRRSHVAAAYINPFYQRTAVSQPPIPLSLSHFTVILYIPLPYARHRFCRLCDAAGCCECRSYTQGISLCCS